MHPELPPALKPALLIGGGVLVLFILAKRSSGGTGVLSPVGQAQAAGDPTAGPAQQLALAEQRRNAAYQGALQELDLKDRAQKLAFNGSALQVGLQNLQAESQQIAAQAKIGSDYASFYDALATGKGYAPGIKCASGKPRIDPETGQVYCRENVGGGFHLLDGINLVSSLFGKFGGVLSGKKTTTIPSRPSGWEQIPV